MLTLDSLALIVLDLVAVMTTLALFRRRGAPAGPLAAAFFLALAWLTFLVAVFGGGWLVPASLGAGGFLAMVGLGVAGVGALLLWAPVRAVVARLHDEDLLALQGVRFLFGATFFAQALRGTLPFAFGILDGLTHMSAGLLGLAAARALTDAPKAPGAQRLAWLANAFGLLDIAVVLSSLSFVLLPSTGAHHAMMYAVFLPAPFWAWWHLFSLRRLTTGTADAPGGQLA